MLCKDCEHFKIVKMPKNYKYGEAKCVMYDLITNFKEQSKLETLNCVKETKISADECINNLKLGKSIPHRRETLSKAIDALLKARHYESLIEYSKDFNCTLEEAEEALLIKKVEIKKEKKEKKQNDII